MSELGYDSLCRYVVKLILLTLLVVDDLVSALSCWEFHIMPNFTPIYEIKLRISGRSILAMDCSIRLSYAD